MSKKKIPKQAKKKKGQPRKRKAAPVVSFWRQPSLLIPGLVIVVLTAVVFSSSLPNQFVNWDDDVNLLENENLREFSMENIKRIFNPKTGTIIGNYNPLPIFTFLVDKELLGGHDGQQFKPWIYHFNNLLLHLICVFLVYRIMLLLKLSREAAIIAALLFGIHPMRVESVAWVTERKDVLLGVFYFSAIYTYIKSLVVPARAAFYRRLTLILFIFSLFAKIQAVSLPLSMLALDYYFKRPLKWNLLIEKWPYWLLSLLFGIAGIVFLSEQGSLIVSEEVTDYGFHHRLAVGAFSFCVYLMKFVFPYEMSPLYPYSANLHWYYWVCLAAIPVIGYVLYRLYTKKQYAIIFGFAFFVFNVMFLLQVLGAGQGLKADRFTYIPYMGLFFIVAWGYDQLGKHRPQFKNYAGIGLGLYLLLFGYMTFQQCKIWKDGGTMWTHVLKYYDRSTLPWGNRARFFRESGNIRQAETDYKKAISIRPSGDLHNSLGKTFFDSDRPQQAIEQYNKAIALKSDEAEFYVNRGAAHGKMGNLQAALQDLNLGIETDPEFSNAYLNRSLVYSNLQQLDNALKDLETYLTIKPYNADIWYEKGVTQYRMGNREAAMSDFNKAIQINPHQPIYWYERGKAHVNMGNKPAGLQDLLKAQSMGYNVDPAYIDAAR